MAPWVVLLAGCALLSSQDRDAFFDQDEDGVPWEQDCDDADPRVRWGDTYYADVDGDGWGDPDATVEACAGDAGVVEIARDCDDTDPGANPTAVERCDPDDVDEDCDGLPDDLDAEGALGRTTWFVDLDDDGYGADDDPGVFACDPGANTVDNGEDCDDLDPALHPDTPWYADVDVDGFGDPDSVVHTCERPAGTLADASDCDDRDATIHPGGTERCDALDADEDCDGAPDDADDVAEGKSSYFVDEDADGYGSTETAEYCDPPTAESETDTDCDDADPAIHPNAREYPNAVDDNCDGFIDVCGTVTRRVPGDYATPADAIAATCPGDTVRLAAGNYAVNLAITTSITLDGPGARLVPLDPTRPILTVTAGQIRDVAIVDGAVGGVVIDRGYGVHFEDVTFSSNVGKYGGALLVTHSPYVEIVDCTFSGNSAEEGGAINAENADELVISGTTFVDNVATVSGGGAVEIESSDWPLIVDSRFERNRAETEGGGVRFAPYVADGTILRTEFVDNWANTRGAGFMNAYVTGTVVRECAFEGNATDPETASGGALGSNYFDLLVEDCTFTDNDTSGVFTSSFDTTVSRCAFEGNTSHGAMLMAWTHGGSLELRDSVFVANGTPGVYVSGPDATIERVDIRDHTGGETTALNVGAGVLALRDVAVANSAPDVAWGQAAWVESADGIVRGLRVDDSLREGVVFAGARLDVQGLIVARAGAAGVMVDVTDTLVIDHASLVGNADEAVEVRADSGPVTLRHVAFVENGAALDAPAATVVEHCVETGSLAPSTGGVAYTCADAAPGFLAWNRRLDAGRRDLHLRPGSALVDAGDPSASDADGTIADIGAYGGAGDAFGHAAFYADDDGDGMYDGWESSHLLDPTLDDGALDRDGDGLDNAAEFALGTWPEVPDTDADGVNDTAEVALPSDPLDPFDP